MRHRILLVLSCCVFAADHAGAAMIFVPPSGFASINLDIDGDSQPEVWGFWIEPGPPVQAGVSLSLDPPAEFQLPGGFAWPGGDVLDLFQTFTTLSELMSAGFYSGTAALTQASQEPLNVSDVVGYNLTDLSKPVIAAWLWGTRGRGPTAADPTLHYLVGWVIDASAHAADSSQPIAIYYHNYGPFPEGHSAEVSLAATGVPEPRSVATMMLVLALAVQLIGRQGRAGQADR